jgi:hypothetical protein
LVDQVEGIIDAPPGEFFEPAACIAEFFAQPPIFREHLL